MKIVALSDTHNRHWRIDVPDGDILIHAGDFTLTGTNSEIADFNNWLGTLPHRHKIVIAGNHELSLQSSKYYAQGLLSNATYLFGEMVEVEGLRIFGSPMTPAYGDWAFMYQERSAGIIWSQTPYALDILVTHGPPKGIGDSWTEYWHDPTGRRYEKTHSVGCPALLEAVERVAPRFHIFGHIHVGYGQYKNNKGTQFFNVAALDENYEIKNSPTVIKI